MSITYEVEGECPPLVRVKLLRLLREREASREALRRLDDEIIDIAQMHKLSILERLKP